ncbi:hypothetical protein VNO78_17451 [Psophocarpus tetragonolobus]|uniref:Lysine-specific demethylase JMJ16 n=1 Tax=Psophocarpus tetragonolobus TaxID=3891 RepID=A0AAN9SHU3_PSOTE
MLDVPLSCCTVMMEADYGKDCTKFEKRENLSVPPGFTYLTSFILKRGGHVKKSDKSTTFPIASEQGPVWMETIPEMNDITASRQILRHRPWIISDKSNHYKPEKSHTEHLPMDLPLNAGHLKGTIQGYPNCSNCLKVTARWHAENATREVLEEAPAFHPTEEEFKDTLKYIASICSRAESFGICRIVPPTCWKPPCFLEKKDIWEDSEFVTQIKRIDGHQVQHAQKVTARTPENKKTKRKRDVKAALDSQLGNRTTNIPNNQNVEKCDCESEPGPKFCLKTFKQYADVFKSEYFNYKDNKKIIGSDIKLAIHQQWEPSVENIEGEYGRIVQNPTEEIKVLCGNTLEAGFFRSGFPTDSDPVETCTYPEYLKSGWNLNNILSLSGSLLSFESSEDSRNFAPKIHVGMCFCPHNWKVEEHHLYSLSYVHLGEPKVWYGIPGRFSVNFETIWKKYLPDLQAGPPDMPDNMVTQLSCSVVKAEGIPVYRCVQYPREFVLVFPGAYHSGVDCGFNCSEAVSFAPLEWLLHGQNVVELYCEQRRKTLLSYDKLLLGAAMESVRVQWETSLSMKSTSSDSLTCKDIYRKNGFLTKALKSRIQSESLKRKFLCNSLVSRRMVENFDSSCKTECTICLRDLHLSAVGCSCSDDKFACLDHAKQFCSCTWSNKILFYRYEIIDLNVLCQAVEGKLSAVFKWAKEYLGLTVNSITSTRSKQSEENVNGSTCSSQNLQTKEPISQTELDESAKGKQRQLQELLNPTKKKKNGVVPNSSKKQHKVVLKSSKKKINAVVSQVMRTSGGSSRVIHSKTKTLGRKFTISKKADPKVSIAPSVTDSRYLSFLEEHVLVDVSSDSTSTSMSSDSEYS